MPETLVELKVKYHELEERIQQAHNEANLFARIGELTEAREAEMEMLRLIKTKDNVFVSLPVHLQLRIVDAKAALYQLDDPGSQIASFVLNAVRARTADMTMQDLFAQRDTIADAVLKGWDPARPAGEAPRRFAAPVRQRKRPV